MIPMSRPRRRRDSSADDPRRGRGVAATRLRGQPNAAKRVEKRSSPKRRYCAAGGDRGEDPLVLFDHGPLPAICVVEPPRGHADDLLEAMARDHAPLVASSRSAAAALIRGERQWVVGGGAGSGSAWHVDPFATSAYHVLLSGRKLWAFFEAATVGARPPGVVADDAAPPADDWFRDWAHLLRMDAPAAFEAPNAGRLSWLLQEPGDLVLVPAGAWHATLSLDAGTLAYTRNVIPEGDMGSVKAAGHAITRDDPSLGDAFARLVLRRRGDDGGE